jgi:hypothetical protein
MSMRNEYNYNFDLECTYYKHKNKDLREDYYRKEVLEVFHLQEAINDEDLFKKLSVNVSRIGGIIFKDDKMKEYARRLANRVMSNDPYVGLLMFFSYDLFWIIHAALGILYNGDVLTDSDVYEAMDDVFESLEHKDNSNKDKTSNEYSPKDKKI